LSIVSKLIHGLVEYGRYLILIVDLIIVAIMTGLIVITILILIRDLAHVWTYEKATIFELQIIVNDVFMLIVFAEIVRSVIVGRRKPEMYLVGVAEVGFVITVREIIASVVIGTKNDLLLSTIAALLMTLVLMIIYKWIIPHRELRVTSRKTEESKIQK
jgi:uncharacterized membrane protein (DUF373 family)